MRGDLTLHGVTHAAAIPISIVLRQGRAQVSGVITFERSEFDVTLPKVAGIVSVGQGVTVRFHLLLERTRP